MIKIGIVDFLLDELEGSVGSGFDESEVPVTELESMNNFGLEETDCFLFPPEHAELDIVE